MGTHMKDFNLPLHSRSVFSRIGVIPACMNFGVHEFWPEAYNWFGARPKKLQVLRDGDHKVQGQCPQYGRNSGKIPERPRKRSQSVSWNSPREYGWDLPNPIVKAFEASRAFPQFSPPQYGWGSSFFSEVVPERASQSQSWNSQQCRGAFLKSARACMLPQLGKAHLQY